MKKYNCFWTVTGGIVGLIFAFLLEFSHIFPYIGETLNLIPFLKNLSTFFHTISCILLSYFWYTIKLNYWKSKTASRKAKKTIDIIAIALMVVIPLSLCVFWKRNIISWLLLTLLSIVISYLISVSDIVNPPRKKRNKP